MKKIIGAIFFKCIKIEIDLCVCGGGKWPPSKYSVYINEKKGMNVVIRLKKLV